MARWVRGAGKAKGGQTNACIWQDVSHDVVLFKHEKGNLANPYTGLFDSRFAGGRSCTNIWIFKSKAFCVQGAAGSRRKNRLRRNPRPAPASHCRIVAATLAAVGSAHDFKTVGWNGRWFVGGFLSVINAGWVD